MKPKNNLKKRLAGLGVATVVAATAVLGGGQICKNNQEKKTQEAYRQTLIHQIYSNPSLNDVQSYVYSDELKALQILINKQLPAEKRIKEDGFLPNSEINSYGEKTSKVAEFKNALQEMPASALKNLHTNLSEKIDMTILDSWAKGDISKDARSAFNRMIQRRAEKKSNDGSATKEIQRVLNEMGENLVVDGEFGPKSKAALDNVFSSKSKLQSFAKKYKIERMKNERSNTQLMHAFQERSF